MDSEMKLVIANVVKDFMNNEREFSNYDIFCEARKQNNWNFRYLSVRDEVRTIVKNAVDEIGNYLSRFETNSKGDIYLVYYLNNEFPDYADELDDDFNDDVDEDLVRTADPEYNRNEDFSDEIDDDYSDEEDEDHTKNYCVSSLEEFNLRLDSRGRVYITKEHIVESNLGKFSKVFVSFFHDKNEVIISDKPIVDADSVKEISMPTDRMGFYVSLKQYFGDTECVTIISKHNKHEIVIIKNY